MNNSYQLQLHIEKETFKFSCAHFTVFDANNKEPLHGHNYRVRLTISLKDVAFVELVNFADLKKILKSLCEDWDEQILIPAGSPHVTVTNENKSISVVACGKAYLFPADEVQILDLPNITAECLAKGLADRLVSEIQQTNVPTFLHIEAVSVRVDETDGQGASVSLALSHT